jgi:hypothetical protein
MKNELAKIAELIARQEPAAANSGIAVCFSEDAAAKLEQACSEAREAWASAVFSDNGKNTLRRYFTYQMRVLSGLLTRLDAAGPAIVEPVPCLTALTDHLYLFFPAYLDMTVTAPAPFARYKLSVLKEKADRLISLFQNSEVNPGLQACLVSWLGLYFPPGNPPPLSLGTLSYLEFFLDGLPQAWESQDRQDISPALEEKTDRPQL